MNLIFAVFDRGHNGFNPIQITGYITDSFFTKSHYEKIRFEGSDGKVYFPKKYEIHTVIP